MRRNILAAIALATVLLAACAKNEEPAAGGATSANPTASMDACAKERLPLRSPGVLTIATDSPAYPPWFAGNDPSNGKGFESAVAYAIADRMGFTSGEVKWVVEPFNKSYAPGPKDFDFDINQISITPKRAENVTFSEGYYDVNQALIALSDSPVASATSIADVKDAKLGAQVGTTSLAYISSIIQPTQEPFVYDTTNDAKSALEAGQIDGIVVDLPTAFYITAVEIPKATVVGQFPADPANPEQFGLLFEMDDPLVDCVNKAIESLKADGTLPGIQQQWLSEKVQAPVLQ
jgi:polar amino acid transport system substrate-binding protein